MYSALRVITKQIKLFRFIALEMYILEKRLSACIREHPAVSDDETDDRQVNLKIN